MNDSARDDLDRAIEREQNPLRREMLGLTQGVADAILDLRRELAELRAAAPTWRGVWSPVGDYQRGQTCSSGGSLWHCNTTGTQEKPGSGNAWSLMTKSVR